MSNARDKTSHKPKVDVEGYSSATVLAFDPGGTTGWCAMSVPARILNYDPNDVDFSVDLGMQSLEWMDYISFSHGQIDCMTMTFEDAEHTVKRHNGLSIGAENRGVHKMISLAKDFDFPPIVLEDFILDFKKADMKRETLSPVRLISMFSYGLDLLNMEGDPMPPIFIQSRSNVKTTATDQRLKNWGLYDRNSGNHARDATRHAAYFLRGCRGGSFEAAQKRHDAWPDLFPDPYTLFPHKKPPKERKPQPPGERIHL